MAHEIEEFTLYSVYTNLSITARTLGASESCQPRNSGQVAVEMGWTFLSSIFVKTRFIQIEGYGRQRHS
jgi:hypothetical protein